jgi:hypothetical protein
MFTLVGCDRINKLPTPPPPWREMWSVQGAPSLGAPCFLLLQTELVACL